MQTEENPDVVGPTLYAGVLGAHGSRRAAPGHDELFSTLYVELHRLARREVRRQGQAAQVNATTLLHEAYLIMSRRDALAFPDESRFLAYAGQAMRGLVIDRVRQLHAKKRGGGFQFISLDTQTAEECEHAEHLAELSEALNDLAKIEPELAVIVDLRFFCGLEMTEIAQLQGISLRTAARRWEKARVMLYTALRSGPESD